MSKKRKILAIQAEFTRHGWGRLYRRLSRSRRNRIFSQQTLRSFLHLLSFKVGDVVSDYGTNHVISKIVRPRSIQVGHRGWACFEMEQFEYADGYLSCGCGACPDPAEPREQIEARLFEWLLKAVAEEAEWLTADVRNTRRSNVEVISWMNRVSSSRSSGEPA